MTKRFLDQLSDQERKELAALKAEIRHKLVRAFRGFDQKKSPSLVVNQTKKAHLTLIKKD